MSSSLTAKMPLGNYMIFLKQEAEDILKNIEMAYHQMC